MRRGIGVARLLVVLLGGVGIAVGAYNAGERHGVAQSIEQVQVAQENGQDVQVVHVVDEGPPRLLPRVLPVPAVLHRAVLPDRRDLPRRGTLGRHRVRAHGPAARGTTKAGAGSRRRPASGISVRTRRETPPAAGAQPAAEQARSGAEAPVASAPPAREARTHATHPGRRGRHADRTNAARLPRGRRLRGHRGR